MSARSNVYLDFRMKERAVSRAHKRACGVSCVLFLLSRAHAGHAVSPPKALEAPQRNARGAEPPQRNARGSPAKRPGSPAKRPGSPNAQAEPHEMKGA